MNPDSLQQFAVIAQHLAAAQQRAASLRTIFGQHTQRSGVDDVILHALREPIDQLAAAVAELASIQCTPQPRKDQ